MHFHRQLSFRILAPIIAITAMVGAATILFALYVTGQFAEDQEHTSLRWKAYMVRQIAEEHLGRTQPPGPDGDDLQLLASRVAALLSIEDFARTQGIALIIEDGVQHRTIRFGDQNFAPPDSQELTDEVLHIDIAGVRHDVYRIDFAPWQWRITVLQDDSEFTALATDLKAGAWVAGIVLALAAFAFMLFLTTLLHRPIQAMVTDLQAGRPPQYTGIAELEFLSGSIARMMAELKEKNAALERYSDELEGRVAERTLALSSANAGLKHAHDELVRTHQQLLHSEKMASIGQLAAGVAHEINNPIGFVNSNVGTLHEYLQDLLRVLDTYERHDALLQGDAAATQEIRDVRDAVNLDFLREDSVALLTESKEGLARVRKIVQNLKDFSHAGHGEWQLADLHKELESTLNIVWNEIKYKATVVKEFGELPEVECLPSELNQVFMNLLVNAAHAISNQGIITIRTAPQGEDVLIEIADTGEGIPPEHIPRLFEPFFTTKPVGKGTGLGLSLSYGIVNKHHGKIDVESTPGKGTVFRVRLPIRQAPQAQAA